MFGDNRSDSECVYAEATLQKKQTAISFHHVRECVAASIIPSYHIDSKDTFADIIAKPMDSMKSKYHA